MSPGAFALLAALASGEPLNGASHAARHGLTRAAVWKQVEALRRAGVVVRSRAGAGYQLDRPIGLLDRDVIEREIAWSMDRAGPGLKISPAGMHIQQAVAAGSLSDAAARPTVEVHAVTESTNLWLGRHFRPRHAVLAEFQTGGRGRRGRQWRSPPAAGICLSFGYEFQCGLPRLGPLSLVAGIAVAETVAGQGIDVGLKWPNDLLVGGRKLGGLLVEIRGPSDGPCQVVIGLGLNVDLADRAAVAQQPDSPTDSVYRPPDQPWTDLVRAGLDSPDRNRLAGQLIAALDCACREIEALGFEPFAGRWSSFDLLANRDVHAIDGRGQTVTGRALGVTGQGGLRLSTDQGIVELAAAEVSIRVC
ncbi:MAG: biotin--[acetyl-CoA-carboxylase] ligase [Xanthomonadaceae bacterium]|nr:biotin--[acetyl-CoA-carboxylase] ligase [Xanthomonadaceae bacterium]